MQLLADNRIRAIIKSGIMSKSPAIGVDLGTTYCCVAVYNGGEDVTIIPNHLDKNTTPSYVAFCDGDITVGDTAKNQAHENPENTIFDVKRMIGRSLQDPFIQRDRKLWPFDLTEVDGRLRVKADDRNLLPEEISTEMLIYLKEIAEANLGCPVTAAVITVPAYFTDYQRYLTKQAAIQAGLKPLQLIREPTAAAIAYNLHRRDHTPQNCLIFDLGGGTFDVAVLTIEQNFIQVRAIGGDARLGGEDFDNIMVDYCIEEFKTQNSVDLAEGKDSDNAAVRFKVSKRLRRIKKECEKQKCYLSQARTVVVSLDAICGELDLAVEFTRGIFENLVEERLSRCIDIVEGVLKDSDFAKEDINDVVLIGGSSRIPKLQAILQEYFGGKTLYRAINPDEAVAAGAAIQAYFANNRDLAGIGIEEPDFVVPNPVALAGSTMAAESGSESPSAPTSDPSSPWSSGVSMRPTLERSNSESPTPTHSKVLRRPAAVLSQMSFTTLSTQSLTCHLALYFDEYMVRIFDLTDGKFDVSSKPVLEVQPFVAIKDSKLYVGSEALKYQHLDSFYRIMDLLTKPTNKICQMAVAGKSDFGILFEEEIIAAFLLKVKQRVEKVLRSSVLQVVITLPFIPTGAQRGRIQVATVLVDLVKVKIYSNLTLTALSYASMRTSLRQTTVFETIRFLVVHYGHGFFSTAVVEYSPTMVRIRSYNSSYLLPEEDHVEFMTKHAMSFEEQDDDEDDEIARHAETYLPFMQSACSEIDKNSIDFGFLIRNQESKSIDDFVTLFFDKTVYTFNDVRGPLTGASILASQNFKFGSTQVVDVIPGNLQCSILRDRRVNVIYDEPHASSDKHGTVFSYPLVLDRERPVAISLVETVLDKTCDICVYRVSAKYINEPRAVSVVLTCEIDVDGMYHLGLDYVETEGVSIDFFRTDKLNSEFSIISNKVDNFNKFFNAVSKSRRGLTGWLTSKKLK